jgi:thiol-disulfide isomerase/thioredoxin
MTLRVAIRPLAAAAALAGLLVACTGSSGQGGIGVSNGFDVITIKASDRKPVPAFSGATLRDGRPISSSILSGKVGVVNFWGSWCGPCLREQPSLEALAKEYATKPVQFLGINTRRDQRAAALAMVDQFHVTYPSVFNPDSSIAYAFRVRFMPATFVIDRQGKIAAEFVGAIASMSELRAIIDSELT